MAINNSTEVKDLVDMGMEKGFPVSDEINDFLPHDIFVPEDVEDVFNLLSESNLDTVETIQEKAVPSDEENADMGETGELWLPSETADNTVWATYSKNMGYMALLTSDEEYQIAKKIEEAEKKAKSILFDLPQAVNELLEMGQQLKNKTVNIVDVINNIDETKGDGIFWAADVDKAAMQIYHAIKQRSRARM
jgi:RNA polymerase primary sigma factor